MPECELPSPCPPAAASAAGFFSRKQSRLSSKRPNVTDYHGFFLDLTDFTSKRPPAEFSAREYALYEQLKKFARAAG
jgi:hypothetical protein